MNTKPIPAIVMLVAGLIACIAGIMGHMETGRFVKMLLIVLIVFYCIGGIAKILMDSSFKEKKEEATDGENTATTQSEDEMEQENEKQDDK